MMKLFTLNHPKGSKDPNNRDPLKGGSRGIYRDIWGLYKGIKDPNNGVSGPKYYNINGIWALKPSYLGPWTLRALRSEVFGYKLVGDRYGTCSDNTNPDILAGQIFWHVRYGVKFLGFRFRAQCSGLRLGVWGSRFGVYRS